jgi:hypothetical protein
MSSLLIEHRAKTDTPRDHQPARPPNSKPNLDHGPANSCPARRSITCSSTASLNPSTSSTALTPLHDWLPNASPRATSWVLQAILARADAAPTVNWRGHMSHLTAVGVILTPPSTTPYLVVKQDDNGATFVVTTTETPWIAADAAACTHVVPREIRAWTHPTSEYIPATTATPNPQHRHPRSPPALRSEQAARSPNRRSDAEHPRHPTTVDAAEYPMRRSARKSRRATQTAMRRPTRLTGTAYLRVTEPDDVAMRWIGSAAPAATIPITSPASLRAVAEKRSL